MAIYRVSSISGLMTWALNFGLIFSSGAVVRGAADLLFTVLFSCWVAAPFLLLGQARVFRNAPRLSLILLTIGWIASLAGFYEAYFAATHSTAALGLLITPLLLLVVYGVSGVTLTLFR